MNVLLLGNGFDLNYHLPTKYINFLNTVQYLSTSSWVDIHTVGDVFGSPKLQKMDKDIAKSYKKYKEAYDSIPLDFETMEFFKKLNDNLLFSYLLQCINRDIGWIDFEREISVVIQSFRELFAQNAITFNIMDRNTFSLASRYILLRLGFYLERNHLKTSVNGFYQIHSDYLIEYPKDSNTLIINKEKITNYLEFFLHVLSEGLKRYLIYFVDGVISHMPPNIPLPLMNELSNMDKVITFNYTHTYEELYPGTEVYHIHGDVKNNIVLGVNPNTDDNIETVNTDFIRFKKYFQRVFYETDHGYLETIKELRHIKNTPSTIRLTVMGHSLDVTDKDVIAELFELAGEIQILYHEKKQVSSYISNLISMFGKETFDDWRISKNLAFVPQTPNDV